jgi:hypothetical protein
VRSPRFDGGGYLTGRCLAPGERPARLPACCADQPAAEQGFVRVAVGDGTCPRRTGCKHDVPGWASSSSMVEASNDRWVIGGLGKRSRGIAGGEVVHDSPAVRGMWGEGAGRDGASTARRLDAVALKPPYR